MRHLRIIIAIGIFMVLAFITAACGGASNNSGGAPSKTTAPAAVTGSSSSGNPRVLVAYYSASGNTKKVAEVIAKDLGGTLFEMVPAQQYTSEDLNYRDTNSRVVKEHNDPNRHVALAQAKPDNFDTYDVIFVAYPIWWREAAWVVNDFIKENNFTGKTVIPVATSTSSPLADSGEKLKAMAGTGNWLEGIRFAGGVSDNDVSTWIHTLQLKK